MKKKIVLMLFVLVALVIALASCGHECDFSVVKAETPATCLTSGTRVLGCSGCDEQKVEIIPSTGHNYQDTVVAPTCSVGGYTTQECLNCGDTKGGAKLNPTPATGNHVWQPVPDSTVEPTCTDSGYSLQKCTVCQTEGRTNVQNKLNHEYQQQIIYTTKPTCTTAGSGTITTKCVHCGEKQPGVADVPNQSFGALGHNWEFVETVAAATCTTVQRDSFTCINEGCGHTKTEDVGNPLGHEYETEGELAQAATCHSLEYRNYKCVRYGQTGCVNGTQGPSVRSLPTADSYIAHTPGDAATCVDEQVCSVCEAALPDAELSTECTMDNANCIVCSKAGKIHVFAEPTGEHDYTEGVTTPVSVTAPTCMREGYSMYLCTTCNLEYKGSITAIESTAHDYDMDTVVGGVSTPATCIKYEFTTHQCKNTAEDGTTRCDATTEKIIGNTYADHTFAAGEPTGVITCTYCQKSFYDTTYIESKYQDEDGTIWDGVDKEFDDDTSLNVTITVSKSDVPPMSFTEAGTKTQVDTDNPDTTKISIIRVVGDANVTITVNETEYTNEDLDDNGYLDICAVGDITSLTVESDGVATVYFYGEDAVPAQTTQE